MAVLDSYAHHPAELAADLAAIREMAGSVGGSRGRLLALFQPHLYSRTLHLAHGFAEALAGADAACVTEIYPAREEPLPGVTGRLIVDELARLRPGMPIGWAPSLEDAAAPRCRLGAAGGHRAHARRRRRRPRRAAGAGARSHEDRGGRRALAVHDARARAGRHAHSRGRSRKRRWRSFLQWANQRSLGVAVVGLGSNLLAADEGVDALVLKLGGELAAVETGEDMLRVGGRRGERRRPPPRSCGRARRLRVRLRHPRHDRRRQCG